MEEDLRNRAFGGLPIEIGYCNGNNKKLNALEYHRSSEINVAVTDAILLIGHQQDVSPTTPTIHPGWKRSSFRPEPPSRSMRDVLHYAPCTVEGNEGFRVVVVLPKDTNTDLTFPVGKAGEDRLITAKNKWLIAHEDAKIEGAFCGLKGENITL